MIWALLCRSPSLCSLCCIWHDLFGPLASDPSSWGVSSAILSWHISESEMSWLVWSPPLCSLWPPSSTLTSLSQRTSSWKPSSSGFRVPAGCFDWTVWAPPSALLWPQRSSWAERNQAQRAKPQLGLPEFTMYHLSRSLSIGLSRDHGQGQDGRAVFLLLIALLLPWAHSSLACRSLMVFLGLCLTEQGSCIQKVKS